MSKKFKRMLSFFLSFLMVFSSGLVTQSFAASGEYGITITTRTKQQYGSGTVGTSRTRAAGLPVDFYLKNGDTATKVGTVVTDANGYAGMTIQGDGTVYAAPVCDGVNYILDNTTETEFPVAWLDTELNTSDGTVLATALTGKSKQGKVFEPTGRIRLLKLDGYYERNTPIANVTFGLYSGDDLIQQGTSDSTGLITFEDLPYGTYKLREISAPAGYTPAEDFEVTVPNDNSWSVNAGAWNFKKIDVEVHKYDNANKSIPIKGAEFTLYKGDKTTVVATATTDANGVATFEDLSFVEVGGSVEGYWLAETKAAPGYIIGTRENLNACTCYIPAPSDTYTPQSPIASYDNEKVVVNFYNDKPLPVYVNKFDKDTGERLAGATITFFYQTATGDAGEEAFHITSTTSQTGVEVTDKVENGKSYVVKETAAPPNYDVDSKVYTFTYTANASNVDEYTFDFNDTKTQEPKPVNFTKTDYNTGTALGGAIIQLQKQADDGSWKIVKINDQETFTTVAGSSMNIELTNGSYKFVEIAPPEGYVKGDDYEFEITDSTTQIDAVIKDKPTEIKILKVDAHDEPLSGAVLQILDKEDNVIEEWTTTREEHVITGKLAVGATYTLHEASAPVGYDTAPDQTFTISEADFNGSTTIRTIKMVDGLTAPVNEINISKTDNNGQNLADATIDVWMLVTNVQIRNAVDGVIELVPAEGAFKESINVSDLVSFDDAKFDNPTTIGGKLYLVKEITTNSTDVTYTVNKLPNATYFIQEVEAPDGYYGTEEVKVVTFDDETAASENVTIVNTPSEILIIKVDKETGKILPGVKLHIEDLDGQVVVSTFTTGETPYKVPGLTLGETYKLVEEETVEGYSIGDPVEFTVEDLTIADTTDTDTFVTEPSQLVEYGISDTYLTNDEVPIQKVLFENQPIDEVKIKFAKIKTGATTETYVSGAKLQFVNLDNDRVVAEWTTSTSEKFHEVTDRLVDGKYALKEVSAPAGYLKSDDIEFTVRGGVATIDGVELQKEDDYYVVKMEDDFTKVTIKKLEYITELGETAETADPNTAKPVIGAHLVIKNSDGQTVEEFDVTEDTPSLKLDAKLEVGKTYTVTETDAPGRYAILEEPFSFTVANTADEQVVIVWDEHRDVRYNFNFSKVNPDGELLGNAVVKLEKLNEETGEYEVVPGYESVTTSETEAVRFTDIQDGTYRIVEVIPPNGYKTAQSIEFTLVEDQERVTPGTNNFVTEAEAKEMTDTPVIVRIKKIASDTEQPLAGATLAIFEKEDYYTNFDADYEYTNTDGSVKDNIPASKGTIIYSFVSTTEDKVITAELDASKTYVLVELAAPDGYDKADVKEFATAEDMVETPVTMIDTPSETPTFKLNIIKCKNNKQFLAGVTLRLYRKVGDDLVLVDEEWISKSTAGQIFEGIEPGEYEVKEVAVPDGWSKLADEDTQLKFVIGDGVNTQDSNNVSTVTVEGEEQKVVEIHNTPTDVTIKKIDDDGNRLADAELELYDSNDNLVTSWKSSATEDKHFPAELKAGETYTLKEVNPPENYQKAADKTFTIPLYAANYETSFIVELVNIEAEKTYDVDFVKTDIATTDEIPGAKLELYKINDVGERTLITNWTSTTETHKVEGLRPGNYVLVEKQAPDGYIVAEEATFTLNEAGTSETKVEMKDAFTKVRIKKLDENGNTLAGASLTLYDVDNGNSIVKSWVSTGAAEEFDRLPVGNYKLVETKAPDNYKIADPVEFTVLATADEQTFTMSDIPETVYDVDFVKTDVATTDEIPGAELELYKVNDLGERALVASWTSTAEAHKVEGLKPGNYVLVEKQAPAGYIVAEEAAFVLNEDGTSETRVEMKDAFTKVRIKKLDENGNTLAGASLTLYDVDNGNTVIKSWISTGAAEEFDRLPVGNYKLVETKAPDNYKIADPVEFTVLATEDEQVFTMTNIPEEVKTYNVKVSKRDITNDNELPDAKLDVTYKNGTTTITADSWKSTTEVHYIKNLQENIVYTLTETSAPQGYLKAESIVFAIKIVNEKPVIFVGKVGDTLDQLTELGNLDEETIIMYDNYTTVEVKKTDKDGNALAGAKLKLVAEDGTVVDSWTSTNANRVITKVAPGKYTIVETEAPEGYAILVDPIQITVAETADVQLFTVKNNLVPEVTTYDVEISKTDITGGPELPGATLIIKTKAGAEVERWVSTTESHKTKLQAGDYTLTELTAPKGYTVAETISFTITADKTVKNVIVMKDAPTDVKIYKQDKDSKTNLKDAVLGLYKEDGTLVEKWITDGNVKEFKKLEQGKYILKEITAPSGYNKADDIKFEVTQKAGVIEITMFDTKVTPPSNNTPPTPPASNNNPPTPPTPRVQTGDSNNVLPIMLALIAMTTLAGVAVVEIKKKRK